MNQSEQVNELVKALAIAQGSFKRVGFDKSNPHYKSKYASLEAIIDATRDQLSQNGLCVVHIIEGEKLESRLLHTSGQWVASSIPLFLDKRSPQAVGSALTYARRYNMCCLLNINAGEDDDAEIAEMVISDEQVDQIESLLVEYPELREKILKTYNIKSFESLAANMFQSVIKRINASVEAKRKTA